MDGTSIDLNLPPPIPIPSVSKSLVPGGKQTRKNTFLMNFYDYFFFKVPCQGIGYWVLGFEYWVLGIATYMRIKYLKQEPLPSDSWVRDKLTRSYVYIHI